MGSLGELGEAWSRGPLRGGEEVEEGSSELSEGESPHSQAAFASSNSNLVSVMVDTLTHSAPFCATMSTSALRCLGLAPLFASRVGWASQ